MIMHFIFLTKSFLCLAAMPLSTTNAVPVAQDFTDLKTRAERTEYRETSHYEDVIAFITALQAKGALIKLEYIGKSEGGRQIPFVIASKPTVASRSEARKLGKAIVYIQANIHGGEVEGKEAVQMLLRELSGKDSGKLLDKLVILVTPVFNIDGNEKWGDGRRNRSSQDGPELIGERPNGQGLDLNRDSMKAEAHETRAALEHIYTTWDPDVMIDLHTTDGTRHGYHLTYSPPLNANTLAGIVSYSRELLSTVRSRMDKEHSQKTQDYGNVEGRTGQRAWRTFGEEGRYVTNYVGLRNRVSILSEAASFLPFKTRVETTLYFVKTILEEIARRPSRVTSLTRDADKKVTDWGRKPETAPPLGVRFEMDSRGEEDIPLEKPKPGEQIDRRKAPTDLEMNKLLIFDRFKSTKTAKLPAAYIIPGEFTNVAELLRRHGIKVEMLKSAWNGEADVFTIKEMVQAPEAFQGHRLVRLEGTFATGKAEAPAGSFIVRLAQPLGILIFNLLEPESLDGVAAWGFLEGRLNTGTNYPILKAIGPVTVRTGRTP